MVPVAAAADIPGFRIDVTEVTAAAFLECVDAGSCSPPHHDWPACNGDAAAGRGKHPINCVDWEQAVAFCGWLGRRLPTEAEWQIAAGSETGRLYPWGDEEPEGRACVNQEGTCPAGAHPLDRSPSGALDMAGNVKEWTASEEPLPGGTMARVFRGGGWEFDGLTPRPAAAILEREFLPPSEYASDLGFRCAAGSGP